MGRRASASCLRSSSRRRWFLASCSLSSRSSSSVELSFSCGRLPSSSSRRRISGKKLPQIFFQWMFMYKTQRLTPSNRMVDVWEGGGRRARSCRMEGIQLDPKTDCQHENHFLEAWSNDMSSEKRNHCNKATKPLMTVDSLFSPSSFSCKITFTLYATFMNRRFAPDIWSLLCPIC